MKKTLMVISTNRGLHPQTLKAVRACRNAGARLIEQSGSSDVALARNHALSMAKRALELDEGKGIDTILMVDDDIVFSLNDAQRVVDRTRETGAPASATYVQQGGQLAASRMLPECAIATGEPVIPMRPGSWHVGLGFVAFSAAALLELAADSHEFSMRGETCWEFTRSTAIDGAYVSEDYCLSRRLGGVELLPLEVGHLKLTPIYPNEKLLSKVAELSGEFCAARPRVDR